MNKFEFSRYAAIVGNQFFDNLEDRFEFAKASDEAMISNPEDPLQEMDAKYQIMFDTVIKEEKNNV